MKTIIAPALLCIALTPTAAFTSLRVALPKTGRELRRATTELPLTVDAMGAPLTAATLPAGKRVVRRRQTRVSSELESEDVAHAPVNRISTDADYLGALQDNENVLVVMKFFAPWCRSCKAMDLKFRRLALENEDVKFYEIDVQESPELKRTLGVKAVPTVKLYAGPLGQVASFACGPRKVPELERKVELCKDVPALVTRLSRGSGMMEMVAGEIDGKRSAPRFETGEQDGRTEPIGIVKGVMEKLARHELLSRALQEDRLNDLTLNASVA